MLVWNVTDNAIRVREVVSNDRPWPADPPVPAGPPDPKERTKLSDWLEAGRVDFFNPNE